MPLAVQQAARGDEGDVQQAMSTLGNASIAAYITGKELRCQMV